MKSIGWMLTLIGLSACSDAEGDPPDARPAVLDGSVGDARPFQIPDAAARIDAEPSADAGFDATPE